jgi:hypothetical protein
MRNGWCYQARMIDAAELDRMRADHGYLSLAETLALARRGNTVFDPFSLLISRGVRIGRGNVFYPAVTLAREADGRISIRDGNTFHPGTHLSVARSGRIAIGSHNQFGPGGFSARAEGAAIKVGDGGRYTLGASVNAPAQLGSGSQILGAIAVQDCVLAAGGTFEEPDPDLRGAVFKGVGRARGLKLARGQVIQGGGTFDATDIRRQSSFHPRPKP